MSREGWQMTDDDHSKECNCFNMKLYMPQKSSQQGRSDNGLLTDWLIRFEVCLAQLISRQDTQLTQQSVMLTTT